MKIVCLVCMVLVTLSLATTAQGFELSSIASITCSLFGFGCPCPALLLPRSPVCLFPTPPLPSMYQDIKGGNCTGFVHVCTKVPLRPLPLSHLNTVSYNDALDMVNLNLYQTQIELDVAKKGEKESSRKLEDSTQALATSLKELATAKESNAALHAQLEQSSQNIKSLESKVLLKEAQLINEKQKIVDLVKRLDAALDKAVFEKTHSEQMERKALEYLMLWNSSKNDKQVVQDNHELCDFYRSMSFILNICLTISLAIVIVLFVRSSSNGKASSPSPQIQSNSSNKSSFVPPKISADEVKSAAAVAPSIMYSMNVDTAKAFEEDQKEVEASPKKSKGKCKEDGSMLRSRKALLEFMEEKAIEDALREVNAETITLLSKPIIEDGDDDKDSEEGEEIREHQTPSDVPDKELDESDFLPYENRSIYVKGNFETTSIYSKLVAHSDKEDSISDLQDELHRDDLPRPEDASHHTTPQHTTPHRNAST